MQGWQEEGRAYKNNRVRGMGQNEPRWNDVRQLRRRGERKHRAECSRVRQGTQGHNRTTGD